MLMPLFDVRRLPVFHHRWTNATSATGIGGNLRCDLSGVKVMDVNAKIGIDSKRTTAASVAMVGVVVYLGLVHLKPILMPLAMAVPT